MTAPSLAPGTSVLAFGKRSATVLSIHGGGKKVCVEYPGGKTAYVKASELKEAK